MKLTTIMQVSVDGVMQGNGPSETDRKQGFERDGWAMASFDGEATEPVWESKNTLMDRWQSNSRLYRALRKENRSRWDLYF